jgi:putative phosphoesterase
VKIAIISDIHDNIAKLRSALERCRDTAAVVCCGDLCSPFIVKELGQGFAGPVHVVFGNNDGDRYRITQVAAGYPQIELHGEFVELEFDGRVFAVNHFDDMGRALARSDHYDVVCYGHNHQFKLARQGKTLVVNPGEVFGGLTGKATFVIYDTESGAAERVDL